MNYRAGLICFSFVAAAFITGCGHKTDAKTEMEKAASALAQEETKQPPPAPAPVEAALAPQQPAQALEAPATPAPPPAQQMQQALASYKAGELEDAVARLQKLRFSGSLTAEQSMTIQDSVAAVMAEIYSLAEKGDARAIQAVKLAEEMQTSRAH